MLLGWQTIGAHEYYLEPSGTAGVLGKAAKGFRTIDGNTYYFQVAGGPGAAGRQIKRQHSDLGRLCIYIPQSDRSSF